MEKKHLLIVEGKEDQSLVEVLLKKTFKATIKNGKEPSQKIIEIPKNNWSVFIYNAGSDSQAFTKLKIEIKNKEYQTIGIIIDTDISIESRWQTFNDILNANKEYKIPKKFNKNNLIFHLEDFLSVGIWLMPDNSNKGMLEDFVKKLIKKDDTLVGFAEETVAKLPDVRFKKSYTTKAVLHTWLAWQEQPNSDIWRGVENKYFDTEITICKEFIQWLKTLYNL